MYAGAAGIVNRYTGSGWMRCFDGAHFACPPVIRVEAVRPRDHASDGVSKILRKRKKRKDSNARDRTDGLFQ
ncbi:unnamed protein product [Fusarium graminearum]|uniref:Uncharacterized protein n=1 Tax=Gibberella zeae TaxID=5518 RepID=A0A4E9DM74_GIBZA|nr:unnamed protein product [Fusarium graminearum]